MNGSISTYDSLHTRHTYTHAQAYTRNKYTSTGVVQWMLNNAYPEMIWYLHTHTASLHTRTVMLVRPSPTYLRTHTAPLHTRTVMLVRPRSTYFRTHTAIFVRVRHVYDFHLTPDGAFFGTRKVGGFRRYWALWFRVGCVAPSLARARSVGADRMGRCGFVLVVWVRVGSSGLEWA